MAQDKSNNALMQQLKKHFDLQIDPFSEGSQFFFEGAQRQHNLETLRHLASFGDMVLFLIGDKGAGKTFLLKKLVSAAFKELNVVYLDCESLLHEKHGHSNVSFHACLGSLGLNADASEPSKVLNCLLKECHRLVAAEGVRTLFIFDNADKLPTKELQAYYDFCKKLPNESALIMLFAGQGSLMQTAKTGSNLEQEAWFHQVQLKPFSQPDVVAYLSQALQNAGYENYFELTEAQEQQLLELGKGLPGRINRLFPSVVLEPGLLKIKTKPTAKGAPVWILFGLAGLLVLSFLFVSHQHGLFEKLIPVFSFEDEVNASTDDALASDNPSSTKNTELAEKNLQQKARLAMLDEVLKKKGLEIPKDQVVQPPEMVAELDEKKSGDIAALNEDEVVKDPSLKVSELGSIEQDSLVHSELNDLDKKDSAIKVIEESAAPKKGDKDMPPKSVVAKVEPLDARSLLGFRSRSWLLQQAESSYLAQILGTYQEETAQNFIKKIGKQKFDVYYLKTEYKGKPWYVVFYGLFPAKTHAQDAVKNAPKIIRNQSPWIRRASEVLASYPKS